VGQARHVGPLPKYEPRIRISWINQRFRAVRMRWCSRHSVQTQRATYAAGAVLEFVPTGCRQGGLQIL
jgi:hypothetical protein